MRTKFRRGDLVRNLYFVPGYPTPLGRDTECRVEEVRVAGGAERLKLIRKVPDGQPGFWWVEASDVEAI